MYAWAIYPRQQGMACVNTRVPPAVQERLPAVPPTLARVSQKGPERPPFHLGAFAQGPWQAWRLLARESRRGQFRSYTHPAAAVGCRLRAPWRRFTQVRCSTRLTVACLTQGRSSWAPPRLGGVRWRSKAAWGQARPRRMLRPNAARGALPLALAGVIRVVPPSRWWPQGPLPAWWMPTRY
jgi:hypothetical protein